jgi:hypothetical protein
MAFDMGSMGPMMGSMMGSMGGGMGGGNATKQGQTTVDNSGAFNDFANGMQNRMGVFNDWINSGNTSRNALMGQYGNLVNDPNGIQDKIAAGFSMSPYQKYMEDMTQKRMNFNAANTGMLGSGAANRALQGELTNMTGQYMNDYINRGMSSYNTGLNGYQNMMGMGYGALGDQNDMYTQMLAARLKGQMSQNAYKAAQDANSGSGIGSTIGTIGGGLVGAYFGGPMGASAGASIGGKIGGSV